MSFIKPLTDTYSVYVKSTRNSEIFVYVIWGAKGNIDQSVIRKIFSPNFKNICISQIDR